jgi:hypothetical protein
MPDRRFIHTHPGFGYRFQPQPAREPAIASAVAGSADEGGEVAPELSKSLQSSSE